MIIKYRGKDTVSFSFLLGSKSVGQKVSYIPSFLYILYLWYWWLIKLSASRAYGVSKKAYPEYDYEDESRERVSELSWKDRSSLNFAGTIYINVRKGRQAKHSSSSIDPPWSWTFLGFCPDNRKGEILYVLACKQTCTSHFSKTFKGTYTCTLKKS